jgi:tetratricopeptide (TPR) repeat protein
MARTAARRLGNRAQEAAQLCHLAWAEAACHGRHRGSIDHALAACRIAVEAGDVRQQAWALAYAAHGYRELGDFERCADLARQAMVLTLEAGDQEGYSQAMARLGDGLHGLGRLAEAMDVRLRLAALVTAPGNGIHPDMAAITLAGIYVNLGAYYAALGNWARAVAYYEMAVRLLHMRDVPAFERTVRLALGKGLAELGRRDESAVQFEAARSLRPDRKDDKGTANGQGAVLHVVPHGARPSVLPTVGVSQPEGGTPQ